MDILMEYQKRTIKCSKKENGMPKTTFSNAKRFPSLHKAIPLPW
jgi:hypothetical protein